MKQTLIETKIFTPKVVENKKGNIIVEGVLATVEVKNGNGRFYSKDLWEREVSKFQQKINEGSTETCGELDHPEGQVVNLQNASHVIRKLWWDGDNIMGLIEIFSDEDPPKGKGTAAGRIAGAFILNGLKLGVSSRGLGSLQQVGEIMEVQDDFELLTWDFVSNPSNPGSWMTPLNESKTEQPIIKENINSLITEILCDNGKCPII